MNWDTLFTTRKGSRNTLCVASLNPVTINVMRLKRKTSLQHLKRLTMSSEKCFYLHDSYIMQDWWGISETSSAYPGISHHMVTSFIWQENERHKTKELPASRLIGESRIRKWQNHLDFKQFSSKGSLGHVARSVCLSKVVTSWMGCLSHCVFHHHHAEQRTESLMNHMTGYQTLAVFVFLEWKKER